jgi:hypothetical protein
MAKPTSISWEGNCPFFSGKDDSEAAMSAPLAPSATVKPLNIAESVVEGDESPLSSSFCFRFNPRMTTRVPAMAWTDSSLFSLLDLIFVVFVRGGTTQYHETSRAPRRKYFGRNKKPDCNPENALHQNPHPLQESLSEQLVGWNYSPYLLLLCIID